MKRIKLFKGAAIEYDTEDEKKGIFISTNTKQVDEVPATAKNIKKYIKDKKYPDVPKKPNN